MYPYPVVTPFPSDSRGRRAHFIEIVLKLIEIEAQEPDAAIEAAKKIIARSMAKLAQEARGAV